MKRLLKPIIYGSWWLIGAVYQTEFFCKVKNLPEGIGCESQWYFTARLPCRELCRGNEAEISNRDCCDGSYHFNRRKDKFLISKKSVCLGFKLYEYQLMKVWSKSSLFSILWLISNTTHCWDTALNISLVNNTTIYNDMI